MLTDAITLVSAAGLIFLAAYSRRFQKLTGVLLVFWLIFTIIITFGLREQSDSLKVSFNPINAYQTIIRSATIALKNGGMPEVIKRLSWYGDVISGPILNVILFIPFGYLVPSVFAIICRWWKVLIIGFVFSLLIETIQLVTKLGWFDASDLLHNTVGAWIGYGLYKGFLIKQRND